MNERYFKEADRRDPRLRIRSMLSRSIKIGDPKIVRTWNLPIQTTCLKHGLASQVCSSRCYAWNMTRPGKDDLKSRNTRERAERNWAIVQRDDFTLLMIGAICRYRVSHFRPHDFGEFFSERYIRQWVHIVSTLRFVNFWMYTRAWVKPEWRDALDELVTLPNISVLFSTDRTMPPPPAEVDEAWLADTDEDVPVRPNATCVVFRGHAWRYSVPLPQMMRVPVCPPESGREHLLKRRCVKCRICLP